jgi:hypothetical protein
MFHIYIDRDSLADIYVSEKDKEEQAQNAWYKIFKKQNCIYVNSANDIKNDYNDEISIMESQDDCDIQALRELYKLQQLADFQLGYNVDLKKSRLVDMDQIENNPSVVHNDPCAIFLLKIDKEKAEKIQKDYGVICQSIDCLDETILTLGYIDISPHYDETGYGWNKVLNILKKYPSNAILINDRNLFANETLDSSSGELGNKFGIENLYKILDTIIPKRFCGEYHVFICFDANTLKKSVSIDYICKQIFSLKRRLRRRNNIIFEIMALHGIDSPCYNITHNRRVLTNYFIITAEHMLKAFDGSRSISSQHITGNKLYNFGLEGYNDAPEKLHRDMIRDYKELISYYKEHPKCEFYTYYINEQEQTLSTITNRILAI